MHNKLVSIAMCTYNGSKFIKEQLESLLNQTYKNIEIVIVDDNSSDDTTTIINEYAKNDSRIRLFENKQNLGFNKNFEKAINLCDGQYIATCDQDDVWNLEKIEVLESNIDNYSLVYSNSALVDENLNSLDEKIDEKMNLICSKTMLNFIFGGCIPGHTMLFTRQLVKYFNFPKDIFFDYYIAMVAASHKGIKYVDKTLVLYRQHTNNVNSKFYKKRISWIEKIKIKLDSKVKLNNELICILDTMLAIETANNHEKELISYLKNYLMNFKNYYFNLKLFTFLYKNRNLFFLIQRRKLKECVSNSKGFKLYKLLPF